MTKCRDRKLPNIVLIEKSQYDEFFANYVSEESLISSGFHTVHIRVSVLREPGYEKELISI